MRFHRNPALWLRCLLALAAVASIAHAPALAAALPATTAPLPTSVTKPPAGKGVPSGATALNFAPFGYVEEEYFVSGKANVYHYDPSGAVAVKTPNMDYTTRILVRRPTSPRRFSGTVRIETSHPQYGIDFVWSRTSDFAIANGDAVVSIAMRRGESSPIEAMKKADPVRYAALNFTESGLNWDIIGQVGRLLKTRTAANPLNGYNVRRITGQGWSGGGALILIYISDGFHDRLRMPGGGPIFDGFLVGEPSGYPQINSTTPAIPTSDPRQQVKSIDVPAISLNTRPLEAYRRRPDGNGRNDRYRVYEVAGAAHHNRRLPLIYKQTEKAFDQRGCIAEVSRFPMHHYFKSALARIDAWGARGVTPPPSQRMALNAEGRPMLDAEGNPIGGVRSSHADVPTARYFANAATPTGGNPSCPSDGAQERFSRDKLVALHGSHGGYVSKVVRRVNELERAGWLLPADARELRMEARGFGGFR